VQEEGTVIRVAAGRAAVRILHEPGPACRGCAACRSLGGGAFAVEVAAADLAEGDAVLLEVPLPPAWRGIVLLFAAPLAALMGGLVVGASWAGLQALLGWGPEGTGLLVGAALGAGAFVVAALEDRRFRRRHRPRVVRVLARRAGGEA
jgi:hypothetical protein